MKNKPVSTPPKPRKRINHGRLLYTGFLTVCMLACFSQQAFAATTVWQKAEEIMKDVYNQILLISTIAAIVTASVARAWLKGIIITWAIVNGLGFIVSYITPFFAGGQWSSP